MWAKRLGLAKIYYRNGTTRIGNGLVCLCRGKGVARSEGAKKIAKGELSADVNIRKRAVDKEFKIFSDLGAMIQGEWDDFC